MEQYCKFRHCDYENIYVKCDTTKRRKRNLEKSSKLTIDFEVKIPYPENSTSNMSDTLKEVQSSVFETMNKTTAVIEVNGKNLTLAETPKLTFVSLQCAKGELLLGAICGRC